MFKTIRKINISKFSKLSIHLFLKNNSSLTFISYVKDK